MSLNRFVQSLLTEGRVAVSQVVSASGTLLDSSLEERETATRILTEFETRYREELPGTPPLVSETSLVWGSQMVFRAVSFLAYRDVDPTVVSRALSEPCPERPSSNVCYSVDLTLRFLPDLIRLARAASPRDPLVESLENLGRQWPLSSVGVVGLGEPGELEFLENHCLRSLYVDRILATRDTERLKHPIVAEAVRVAIGIHHDFAPDVVETLQSLRQNQCDF